ncbi:hypothetical protein [Mycoplasma feriruminatoris]|uniref:hypothetical protein n=1 Tax=Mycoplasma feriruminatoris TaxID=1179777 RepID=UPI00241D2815|nr:hypothetical protein [Mycoplasma feriruminatoris]
MKSHLYSPINTWDVSGNEDKNEHFAWNIGADKLDGLRWPQNTKGGEPTTPPIIKWQFL